ncbi:MAG: hypothetical protein MZW92_43625 [Comamonadaceae bacterium]|nr:hypothetical protein [Comamonadaceae bacterium]
MMKREGALRRRNLLKARDHLQLAVAQARKAELRERAEQLLVGLEGGVQAALAGGRRRLLPPVGAAAVPDS